MLIGCVVHDEVEDHADPALLRFGDQAVEVGERAVHGIDLLVVGDVVAEVHLRRREAGGDPDRSNSEILQVVELRGDAVEISDAVTVAVGEAAGIDLVEDRMLPPLVGIGRLRERRARPEGEQSEKRRSQIARSHGESSGVIVLDCARIRKTMSRPATGALILALALGAGASADEPEFPSAARIEAVHAYIRTAWTTLSRSNRELPAAAEDPKLHLPPGTRWPVYLSCREDRERVEHELRAVLAAEKLAKIELRVLPPQPLTLQEHGLLYLPRPYVVPGGRFNEMYGWDSYFIQLGLLRDGELQRARDMVENFLYEIEYYGTILNANRTYYLSRSQPPFLTRMILGVYQKTRERNGCAGRLPAVDAILPILDQPASPAGETGLSRYYDLGDGPAPRSWAPSGTPRDAPTTSACGSYFRSPARGGAGPVGLLRPQGRSTHGSCSTKADRSMRESGFDPSTASAPLTSTSSTTIPSASIPCST